MRTTLSLDDDLIPAVKSLAATKNVSFGSAVSSLIRAGLNIQSAGTYPIRSEDDFPTFRVRENARMITIEDVKRLEDEI